MAVGIFTRRIIRRRFASITPAFKKTAIGVVVCAFLCSQTLAGFYHTQGNQIVDENGNPARFNGINWFGFETANFCPHGLWARSMNSHLDQMRALGYNLLRIPYCNQMFNPGVMPNGIDFNSNPDLQGLTPIEVLDKLVERAGARGFKIILDRHRPDSAAQSELWYTANVSEQRWIDDWKMLAQRYATNDTVIGADLHNEPHGSATWGSGVVNTDWRLAAERCGNAILSVNTNWLIIVEGIENYQNDFYWWGGNLKGAGAYPIRLSVANRLVYSTHDYGPGVFNQSWFSAANFPTNMPAIYDTHWAYLHLQNIAPVLVGEFGGRNVDTTSTEGVWQNFLVDYIASNHLYWTYWCWNPNSGDTGGVLNDDWTTVNTNKQNMLNRLINAAPPTPPNVPTNLTATAISANAIRLAWSDVSSEESYRIERSTNGTSFSEIAGVAANVTAFTNTGLSAGTTYFYRVRATNSAGASAFSTVASATTFPAQNSSARPATKILFGMGDNPGAAITRPLFTNAPVKMITCWYNGPGDLSWLSGYTNSNFMSDRYGMGNCFEVVVWLANHQSYATNSQFLADMRTLARIFKGQGPNYGPAYFVLFTELETYAASSDTNYWTALQSNYLQAVNVIHEEHPQSHVALGFGGYGWLGSTGSRDLSFWEPAIAASDFTASQAMTSAAEAATMKPLIKRAVHQLGGYCKPVMISHFKIWSTMANTNVTAAFDQFLDETFTDLEMADLAADGLFAWGWMDDHYIRDLGPTFDKAASLVMRYASTNIALPTRTNCPPSVSVIVDNADMQNMKITGAWVSSTSTAGYYGTNYLHDNNTGASGGKSVQFIPNLPRAGRYDVYALWQPLFNRASNVPIDVVSRAGTTMLTVNQQTGGGRWFWLGKFDFDSGTNGSVTIRNDGANNYVIADAVKFDLSERPPAGAPQFLKYSVRTNQFELQFNGDADAIYRAWGSSNLAQWHPLGLADKIAPGLFQFSDSAVLPQRFYHFTSP